MFVEKRNATMLRSSSLVSSKKACIMYQYFRSPLNLDPKPFNITIAISV